MNWTESSERDLFPEDTKRPRLLVSWLQSAHRGQQARRGKEDRSARPLLPPTCGPSAPRSAAWPRAPEPSPTVKPAPHAGQGPARLLLHSESDHQTGRSSSPSPPSLPPVTGVARPCGSGGLRFCKPKGCAFGSQARSMWLPGLVLWTKVKCGMASRCLSLSTPKGQTVAFTLCTNAASAFAISIF